MEEFKTNPHISSIGTSFIRNQTSNYVENNKNLWKSKFSKLNEYFNLEDSLILDKIKLCLYPFSTKLAFLYKPDLYIPISALLSFVLLKSIQNRILFPQNIFRNLSTQISFLSLFSVIYSIYTYFIGLPLNLVESICFAGYGYFYLSISLFLKNLLPKIIYFACFFYLCFVYFFFSSRSLNSYLESKQITNFHEKKKFLLVIVALETLLNIYRSL